MVYKINIFSNFCYFLGPLISCQSALEMDYLISCYNLFYISFRTISIIRTHISKGRRIFRLPLFSTSSLGIAKTLDVIKFRKGMAEIKNNAEQTEVRFEGTNSKRELESLDKTSSNIPYKKLKLLTDDDLEIPTISEKVLCDGEKNKKKRRKSKTTTNTMPENKRPNYYVAVKISDPDISSTVEKIQQNILIQDDRMHDVMAPLDMLHITLLVMNLKDEEAYNRAVRALGQARQQIQKEMEQSPMNLEFCGVGHFSHRVIYGKVQHNESYKKLLTLNEVIRSCLAEENILVKEEFTPHLTVGKLRFNKKSHRNIRKINPVFYESFKDVYFGNQLIDGFYLFNMLKQRDEITGKYAGYEFLF